MNRARDGRHARGVVCVAVALALVVVPSRPAWADATRVVVLQAATASPGARRCLTLIREELAGGGFQVETVDPGSETDPFALAEAMQAQLSAVATIGLVGDPETGQAEIWILDRTGGNTEVRRIPAPPEDPARVGEVLAIRTIEVLRASALKLQVDSSRPRPPPPPSPSPSPPARPAPETVRRKDSPPAPQRRSVALEAGVSMLVSPGQLDPAAVPLARLRVVVAGPMVARLTIAGLGTRPRVETSRGSAAVAQEIGLLELGAVFRRDRRLAPTIMLEGGVLHVRSDGEGAPHYIGRQDQRWAALAGVGAGVVVALSRQLAVAFEAHVVVAAPYPLVRFDDLDAAQVARPALWTTLTLVSWL